ncbi:MAG: macrophage stimulating factor [Massilia sp.]|nr:macrophage stimulating factor [Massilia sp.]
MESVIVYTGKDLRQMREDGGCGHWTASPIRVEAAQYLVCVRNRREQWAAADFEHGVAFLIARIDSTKPSPHAARITIGFNSYAMLDIPNAWELLAKRQRFPVAYMETSELFRRLQLNPDDLTWCQLLSKAAPLQVAETTVPYALPANPAGDKGAGLTGTIAEAKRKLAESLGIASERIEITIRL